MFQYIDQDKTNSFQNDITEKNWNFALEVKKPDPET